MSNVTTIGMGLLFGYLAAAAGQLPQAAVTIRVLNENKTPLSGIEANITFDQPKVKPNQWGSPDVENRKGKTDSDGLFGAVLASGNHVAFGARCDGRYASLGSLDFSRSQNGRWQPWNPTVDLVLKQILNPTAMYARRINRAVPDQNTPVGFDMLTGDFVAPFGRGVARDMIFHVEALTAVTQKEQRRLIVSFPKAEDGVLPFRPTEYLNGSVLRSPYNAPETGYLANWTVTRHQPETSASGNYDPQEHGYFFRVRTVVDSSGKLISANYGKIYGDFMNFTYYLNPTPNDRNIEFDPKRNLFTNLKPEEQVTEP